jgi:hypothetical protein
MDLEKEFKKLNYALDSYACKHHADYEENVNEGSVTLLLLDSGEMPILSHKAVYGEDFASDVTGFKKQAIKFCSHVKT